MGDLRTRDLDAPRAGADVFGAVDAATRAVASVLSVDEVLQVIVDQVRPLVGAQYAALGIVDPSGVVIERFITSGLSDEARARIGPLPRGHGFLGLIIKENSSFRIPDINSDPRRYGFPPHHPPMTSFLGVPVTVKGRSVGNLYLTNKQDAVEFTEADQAIVETFARHAAIAIDNARLHEQVHRLAVVDERERIGKDLHDGIIQSIYAVGLSLEDVPELIADDPDEVVLRVERAIDTLHLTIRDIRNFIFGLRPELLGGTTLIGGLAALVDDFRHNSMVDLELVVGAVAHEPPDAMTSHLLGIVNEALSNVARHSAATRALVELARDDRGLTIIVRDNGRGFDPGTAAALGHQGLRNMRSRAADIERHHGHRQLTGARHRDPGPAEARFDDTWRGWVTTPSEGAAPTTLLVVDDHEVVRQGLVALLDRRAGFQVVAEAGTAADAVEQARRFRPNLVVMDVRLSDGSGIEACRDIRAELPDTRVVMLTSYPDEDAVLAAIVAGASGYLLKQVRARDLVAALETVAAGGSLLDPAVTGKVLDRMRRIATGDDELAVLTQQERKILALVAEGKTNKEIAADVFL
jgi:DNA-binding NarL/FixJ family response regulator/signal transduction histidine kinase